MKKEDFILLVVIASIGGPAISVPVLLTLSPSPPDVLVRTDVPDSMLIDKTDALEDVKAFVSRYPDADVELIIDRSYWPGWTPENAPYVITQETLERYPQVRDGIESEENQRCPGYGGPCYTIVKFKMSEIDAVGRALGLKDCSSPGFAQMCRLVQYNGNYYTLRASIAN